MTLYDNHVPDPAIVTRALEIDFDLVLMTAEIVAEYDLGASCEGQGSAFDMLPGGHVVAACSSDSDTTSAIDPFVYEFDAAGSDTVWVLQISCDDQAQPTGGYRGLPMYRGQPFKFVH